MILELTRTRDVTECPVRSCQGFRIDFSMQEPHE